MTHYNRDYNNLPAPQKDEVAIVDIKEYLSAGQWNLLMEAVADPTVTTKWLDIALNFCGVRGFPNHAFIRTYRPAEYQAWYDSLPD